MTTIKVKNGCYLVRRGSSKGCLDTCLLEQAEELGVNIHFASMPEKEVPIKVNATGPKNATAFVKGIKFKTNCESGYHMAFGSEIATGFYSYLLIKNGHGTIATVFNRKLPRGLPYLRNQPVRSFYIIPVPFHFPD